MSLTFKTAAYDWRGWEKALTMAFADEAAEWGWEPQSQPTNDEAGESASQSRPTNDETGNSESQSRPTDEEAAESASQSRPTNAETVKEPQSRPTGIIDVDTCVDDVTPPLSAEPPNDGAAGAANGNRAANRRGFVRSQPQSRSTNAGRSRSPHRQRGWSLPKEAMAVSCDVSSIPVLHTWQIFDRVEPHDPRFMRGYHDEFVMASARVTLEDYTRLQWEEWSRDPTCYYLFLTNDLADSWGGNPHYIYAFDMGSREHVNT